MQRRVQRVGLWLGFSTGALALGDFAAATNWMVRHHVKIIELSALRFDELEPLVARLPEIPIKEFTYVSFHAPSFFKQDQERRVIELLRAVKDRGWNIIVHPDVLYRPRLWADFGPQLLIENMDRRKATGRTVEELTLLFSKLPEARLCLDVAHARQLDTSLKLLSDLISMFWDRVAEVHISELDSMCHHRPMSNGAVIDYQRFARWLGDRKHVIIESALEAYDDEVWIKEFHEAERSLGQHTGERTDGRVARERPHGWSRRRLAGAT